MAVSQANYILSGGKKLWLFFDWNGDGKKDIIDDFIEYKSYEEFSKNNKNQKVIHILIIKKGVASILRKIAY